MRPRHLVALVAGALLTAGCAAETAGPAPRDPATLDGPVVVLAAPEGVDAAEVLGVLDRRLIAAGLGRAAADPAHPAHVRCLLDGETTVAQAQRLAPRLAGPGTLEFRVVAPDSEARAEAARRADLKEFYRTPFGLRWVPRADEGGDVLIEVPEEPAEKALRRAEEESAPPERIRELRATLDASRAAEVFTGDDLGAAEARRTPPEVVVHFAMSPGRATAFEDFTRRNLKQQLAILLDGAVRLAPVIQSPLPGEGVISGGGASGFEASEAAVLAAILDGELRLPVALEIVRVEAPGDAEPR